ncbi:hypothetical protein [Bartonella saheliensis]|uniref:hypothetical protein n=1 Tax=Bartonella saheliensis TaxID=1457016 RepID=UPI0011AA5B18|nr:hypothetical protein [Bartonella saheliensis]
MFKIFENRVCSFIFTLFILFFVQTMEGNASLVQNQFQGVGISATLEKIVETLEKRVITETVDKAVIHDVEGQKGLSFVKGIMGIGKDKDKDKDQDQGKDQGKRKYNFFSGFNFDMVNGFNVLWAGACSLSLVVSLCVGDVMGAAASFLGIVGAVVNYVG